jgi:hypothetical protein
VPADGDSFTIEMTKVPQGACIDLLMTVAGRGRDPGLFAAEASATGLGAAYTPTGNSSDFTATPSPMAANTAVSGNFGGCNAGGSGGTVGVDFGFTLK